jgi:drug/metabolite transporter (DMT)-like permease
VQKSLLYSHFKLHFVVLIYGFTAILGKLISLPAHQLVWYRMLIAAITFFALFHVRGIKYKLPIKEIVSLIGVGIIVGAHWITFFGAVKLSNVSVTLSCLASATLFTGILEPIFFKKKINPVEILIGIFIILGLYLIFQFEFQYWKGIMSAVSSAFLAALFTVLNRKFVAKHRASIISFYEMLGGFAGITVFLLVLSDFNASMFVLQTSDILYLMILSIICTAFAFTIQVEVMKQLTAYIVSLAINLEPIYGIVLAIIFFGQSEYMSPGFYFGALVIFLSVFGYPLYQKYKNKYL